MKGSKMHKNFSEFVKMDSVLEELILTIILAQLSQKKVHFRKLVGQDDGALTMAGYFVKYKNAFTISIPVLQTNK